MSLQLIPWSSSELQCHEGRCSCVAQTQRVTLLLNRRVQSQQELLQDKGWLLPLLLLPQKHSGSLCVVLLNSGCCDVKTLSSCCCCCGCASLATGSYCCLASSLL